MHSPLETELANGQHTYASLTVLDGDRQGGVEQLAPTLFTTQMLGTIALDGLFGHEQLLFAIV